ncbi:hypothetical protein [Pseudomonas sp. NBRC 111121]|uniref:hypothetical protein n=1 Tax=Pseudomonas sp. NBRC 111121 TaxID=1661036 RepID=UPI0012E24171|nr:hypothetical protein [Pseudomonas sp. NBRC 111121]
MKTSTTILLATATAFLIAVFVSILSTLVHSEKQSPSEFSLNEFELRSSKVAFCVEESCILSTDAFFVFPRSAINEINKQSGNSFNCFRRIANKDELEIIVCGGSYKKNDNQKASTTFKDKLNEVIARIQANQ